MADTGQPGAAKQENPAVITEPKGYYCIMYYVLL